MSILQFIGISLILGTSTDCLNINILASGLRLGFKQPGVLAQIQTDCCSASGVQCDGNERVTYINWNNWGMDGYINGSSLPSELTYINLSYNQLTGTIPTSLPPHLANVFLHVNKLTGGIPASLPNSLSSLKLYGNRLGGDLPEFSKTMSTIDLGTSQYDTNRFTGTLNLYMPYEVLIYGNWISDVYIQSTSLLVARCDLSNNPLLGNPRLVNLTMCTKTGLYTIANTMSSRFVTGITF